MKRLIMLAAAALLCAAPAANAQKVNDAALKSKAAKSDSDIQDAKKAAKGSTWLNRGKAYYDDSGTFRRHALVDDCGLDRRTSLEGTG